MTSENKKFVELVEEDVVFEAGGGRVGLFGYSKTQSTMRFQHGASPTANVVFAAKRNGTNTFTGLQTFNAGFSSALESYSKGLVVPYLRVETTPSATPPDTVGTIRYNTEEMTLELVLPDGVVLQFGSEVQDAALNTTGATIPDGSVIYVSGASGSRIAVGLADADSATAWGAMAVATQAIANNQKGKITLIGAVNNINTSAFSEGALVYLGTTPGSIVATPPAYPAKRIAIGFIARSHATLGTLVVNIRDLSKIDGVGAAGQLAVWSSTSEQGGYSALTYDGSFLSAPAYKTGATSRISSTGRFDASSLYNSAWAGSGVRGLLTDNAGMGYATDGTTFCGAIGAITDTAMRNGTVTVMRTPDNGSSGAGKWTKLGTVLFGNANGYASGIIALSGQFNGSNAAIVQWRTTFYAGTGFTVLEMKALGASLDPSNFKIVQTLNTPTAGTAEIWFQSASNNATHAVRHLLTSGGGTYTWTPETSYTWATAASSGTDYVCTFPVVATSAKFSNLVGTGNRPLVAGADGSLAAQDASTFRTTIGAQAALTNPVTGTGSNNALAVWNGTTTVTAGNVTYDGARSVAIGGTSNAGALVFNRGSDGAAASFIGHGAATGSDSEFRYQVSGGSAYHSWYTNNGTNTAERMRLTSAGVLQVSSLAGSGNRPLVGDSSGGLYAQDAATFRTTIGAAGSSDLAGYQPLDSDLTAIAALSTTTFGRSLLTQADAAAARTALSAVGGSASAAQVARWVSSGAVAGDAGFYTEQEAGGTTRAISVGATDGASGFYIRGASANRWHMLSLSGGDLEFKSYTGNDSPLYIYAGASGPVMFGRNVDLASGKTYKANGTQVVGSRKTGWTAITGTAQRSGFDTATGTITDVKQTLKALIDDLISHGLIGA